MVNVAIIGAGINGVCCGVKIKERYKDFKVVIISKEFTPNTTGDGSGGLWYPYLCGNTSEHLLTKWGIETYNFLRALWLEGGYDVIAMPIYYLYREVPESGPGRLEQKQPGWTKSVFGYRSLDKAQLEYFSKLYSVEYAAGHTFTTFQVLPPSMISYLHSRYLKAGGTVVGYSVTSLEDPLLKEFDVIINCTGLGARELVPDRGVFPIRGQIFKVSAPWMTVTIIDENSCYYIIPNTKSCILGGTHQDNNFDTTENKDDTEHIMNGCTNLIPGLKHAQIVNKWVGLRPGRDAIRIESETRSGRLYVHNYGHGGSGLTLFWGCGNEVLNLLENHLPNYSPIIKSKI